MRVPFTDRFQLLGLKRDEGACSFEAREIATGRPVLVHLFADRASPLNRALLAKVDALPASERSRIIDRGEHEGGVYIVTDRLAEYPGLHEWLKAKHADQARPLDQGGAWRINSGTKPTVDDQLATLFETAPTPVVEPSPLDDPKPPVLTDTGEMTLLMPTPLAAQPRPKPAPPPVQRPAPPVAPKAEPAPAATKEPGEFTRLFMPTPVLRPAAPAAPKVEPPPVAPAPPAGEFTRQFAAPKVEPPPSPVPPSPEPGEFTRQFAPPVPRPAAPAASASPAPNPPGEFTREFAPPVLRTATPMAPAQLVPPPDEPGEFTRQFAPPVLRPVPPRVEPSAPQQPGEFTRQFAATHPAPPAKAAPGEFTKQFELPQRSAPERRPASTTRSGEGQPTSGQQPSGQQPSAQQPSAQQPGEFTQMLQAQRPTTPEPPRNPSSGEFNRFFDSPLAPAPSGSVQQAAPLVPPPSPPRGAGEFTQVFGRDTMPSPPPLPASAAPPLDSSGHATQVFNVQRPGPAAVPPVPPPNVAPQGPGEFTMRFARQAPLTLGQAPSVPQAPHSTEPVSLSRNSSRWPMLLLLGAALLLVIAAVLYFVMRSRIS